MKPTLANRSDLAPRTRQLLAQQLAECDTQMQPLLHDALDDLEQELFRIAEQSSGGQTQHEALEALRELKRARPGFHAYLMALLEQRFAGIGEAVSGNTAAHAHPGSSDLSLVDPKEFDEAMALDDLSSRLELHASNDLFELCHRYAVLVAAPPLESDALPPGPHALAAVLGEAARTLGIEGEHRRLFYRLCDRRLFAAAESFYGRLNEQLKDAGILPHLRSFLPRRARSESSEPAPPAPESASLPPIAPLTDFSPPRAPEVDPAAADMAALHDLLDSRRHALETAAQPPVAEAGHAVSLGELESALAALQMQPARTGTLHPGERLRDDLLAQLRRTATNGEAPRLEPGHRDAVDLMSLLCDRLIEETRAEGTAQQLLSALQVPLLRVALTDHQFFTVRDHPARHLLNSVLETANLWLDRSDGSFDTALNQRLQRSVQRVTHEFNGDVGIFEREASDLDAHLKLLRRRAEIAERRHIEAAKGRDRLQTARSNARAAIAKRLARHQPAPLTRALLEHAWADALTLTLLREGEHSEAYRRQLAVADELLEPSTAREDARLAADVHRGLTQVGLQSAEADQITRHALDLPRAEASKAPQVSHTELLIRLKSRQKPDEPAEQPAARPRKIPLTATEHKALQTLKALPFGAWLEFTVNQQGQKVARKLAWYSPLSGRCLLVNARGAASQQNTLEQLARQMARGQVRELPPQDGGMLDRAWGALVAGLRKFGRSKQPSEAAT